VEKVRPSRQTATSDRFCKRNDRQGALRCGNSLLTNGRALAKGFLRRSKRGKSKLLG
jgi:hypothetical protein